MFDGHALRSGPDWSSSARRRHGRCRRHASRSPPRCRAPRRSPLSPTTKPRRRNLIPAPTISSTITTSCALATTTTTTSAPSPMTTASTSYDDTRGHRPCTAAALGLLSCDFAVRCDTLAWAGARRDHRLSGIGFYPSESADPNTAGIVVRHGPAPGNLDCRRDAPLQCATCWATCSSAASCDHGLRFR